MKCKQCKQKSIRVSKTFWWLLSGPLWDAARQRHKVRNYLCPWQSNPKENYGLPAHRAIAVPVNSLYYTQAPWLDLPSSEILATPHSFNPPILLFWYRTYECSMYCPFRVFTTARYHRKRQSGLAACSEISVCLNCYSFEVPQASFLL